MSIKDDGIMSMAYFSMLSLTSLKFSDCHAIISFTALLSKTTVFMLQTQESIFLIDKLPFPSLQTGVLNALHGDLFFSSI